MKKKILIALSALLLLLFIIYNVGIQIGDLHIGKQYDDIETSQKFDIENSPFSKDYLQKEQTSVINLWASWCKPCVEEMPIFEQLKKEFPQYKFAFLSIDKNKDDLEKGIETFKVKPDITLQNALYRKAIRNFLDSRELNSLIQTEIVPVTYIIKDGKVVYKEAGGIDYEEFSKKLKSLQ